MTRQNTPTTGARAPRGIGRLRRTYEASDEGISAAEREREVREDLDKVRYPSPHPVHRALRGPY